MVHTREEAVMIQPGQHVTVEQRSRIREGVVQKVAGPMVLVEFEDGVVALVPIAQVTLAGGKRVKNSDDG